MLVKGWPHIISLEDLLREFIKRPNYKWSDLPEKVFLLCL